MITPGSANSLLFSADDGYNITRSLRFRNLVNAHLNRTLASGDRQTWTWSAWLKRSSLSAQQALFGDNEISNYSQITFQSDNKIRFGLGSGATNPVIDTVAVFRDTSAWYHIVAVADTTNATGNDRMRIYVNGVRQDISAIVDFPMAQNYNGGINRAVNHSIGRNSSYGTFFDGYLTEVNFIDGQALTASSFGQTNPATGVWGPKKYIGTYGTNGFYLPFTDNSATTSTTLGKDNSGNNNNWTPSGFSVQNNVSCDSLTDVPTLTSSTTANYATLNPLACPVPSSAYMTAGNLEYYYNSTSWISAAATIAVSSGKYYWEVTAGISGSLLFGIADVSGISAYITTNYFTGQGLRDYGYYGINGQKYTNSGGATYGATYTSNDVIGVALDMDAGTLTFYKNGTSQGVAFTGLSGTYAPTVSSSGAVAYCNFGQRPFAYTPPTGHLALNAYNLPDSNIIKGNTVMDATLYAGTGASLSVTNAAGFKPDLVWVKARTNTSSHNWYDSIRGVNQGLASNSASAEFTLSNSLTAFNSNGFTVGSDTNVNSSSHTYVGWQWQAGQGTTSTNTNGSITSTVSVNANAGFSIVRYTGTGATGGTIGHGLGVAPSMIIVKDMDVALNWVVYHTALGKDAYIFLNSASTYANLTNAWGSANPTSSVFGVYAAVSSSNNYPGSRYVAYCFAPIKGFSQFGYYLGNSYTDGPFVHTGFKPKFVMYKTLTETANWVVLDSARDPYNAARNYLLPSVTNTEYPTVLMDFLSNGFKLRFDGAGTNLNGQSYLYMAFAENPFKNSLAR